MRCIGALAVCLHLISTPRRLGKVIENLRGLTLGKLLAIEIDSHFDTTIGGTRERLHDGPVGQHIGGDVDFYPGAIDKSNVNVFKILSRRVMYGRRGIGMARRECGEQETSRDVRAGRGHGINQSPIK